MSRPIVSIVMPAYNVEQFIGEAIQSVLEQTFTNWELLIVDDGSTDATATVVAQFDDPRIHYQQQSNRGVCVARNVGIERAAGKYLAFLDADDRYRPEKLATQVAFLEREPMVGLTYGARIEIDQHGQPVNLAQLPLQATLETVVLGFPFAPTDLMVRREWVELVGGFRQPFVVNEDRDLYIRLLLVGCRCVGMEQFLAYRRLHTEKRFGDLPARFNDMQLALATAFDDPRCPPAVAALSYEAQGIICLDWAYQAAIQNEMALAERYFREGLRYMPSILKEGEQQLVRRLVHAATRDGGDHAQRLPRVFMAMPPAMAVLAAECEPAIARGYLIRGVRHLLWGRAAEGDADLAQAVALHVAVDESFLKTVSRQLLNYELAFGHAAARTPTRNVVQGLKGIGARIDLRRLQSHHAIGQAFKEYHQGHYAAALPNALRAIFHNPAYLMNRGVGVVLLRSLLHTLTQT